MKAGFTRNGAVLIPGGLFLWFMMSFMSGQQGAMGAGNNRMMDFGKSRATMVKESNETTFEDVAGLQEEKEDLEEVVDFLKDPEKYTRLGARIPKGVDPCRTSGNR